MSINNFLVVIIIKFIQTQWPQRKLPDPLKEPQLLRSLRKEEKEEVSTNKRRGELKPSQSTSTESSNKSTQRLVFQREACTLWTHSSMTSSKRLPLKPPNWSDTTRSTLFHPERSNLPSDSSSQVNSLSTPYQKEPRLLPSTAALDSVKDHLLNRS